MTGISTWQAFTQIFSIAHCGYQPVRDRILATVRTTTGGCFNLVIGRQGTGEIALGGPIVSLARDVLDGFRRRPFAGTIASMVGRHSVWSSLTGPYGTTHMLYIGDARSPPSPVSLSALGGVEPWRIASRDCNAGDSGARRRRNGPEPWACRGRSISANTPGWGRWRWTRFSR